MAQDAINVPTYIIQHQGSNSGWREGELITAQSLNKMQEQIKKNTDGFSNLIQYNSSQPENEYNQIWIQDNNNTLQLAQYNDVKKIIDSLAQSYDPQKIYTIGDMVSSNGELKICKNNTTGEWNNNNWENINLIDIITDLNEQITQINENKQDNLIIDSDLSLQSQNPVENKIITKKIQEIKNTIINEMFNGQSSTTYWEYGHWSTGDGTQMISGDEAKYYIKTPNYMQFNNLNYYIKADQGVIFTPIFYNGNTYVKRNPQEYPYISDCLISAIAPQGATGFRLNARTDNLDNIEGRASELGQKIHFFKNQKQNNLTFDSTPIKSSENPVTSGGVYSSVNNIAIELDTFKTTIQNGLNKEIGDRIEDIAMCNGMISLVRGSVIDLQIEISNKANAMDVPTKISDLNNDVGYLINSDNQKISNLLIKPTPISLGDIIQGKYIKYSNGSEGENNFYNASNYIDISNWYAIQYKRIKITSANTYNIGISFYDNNKTFIFKSGIQVATYQEENGYYGIQEVIVPQNAKYARFTILADSNTYGEFKLYGITQLLVKMQQEQNARKANIKLNTLNFAEEFNQNGTYGKGTLVTYNNKLYLCRNFADEESIENTQYWLPITIYDYLEGVYSNNIYNNIESNVQRNIEPLLSIFAPEYDTLTLYYPGEYVTYLNHLWKCQTTTGNGDWNSSDWIETTITGPLEYQGQPQGWPNMNADLLNKIGSVSNSLSEYESSINNQINTITSMGIIHYWGNNNATITNQNLTIIRNGNQITLNGTDTSSYGYSRFFIDGELQLEQDNNSYSITTIPQQYYLRTIQLYKDHQYLFTIEPQSGDFVRDNSAGSISNYTPVISAKLYIEGKDTPHKNVVIYIDKNPSLNYLTFNCSENIKCLITCVLDHGHQITFNNYKFIIQLIDVTSNQFVKEFYKLKQRQEVNRLNIEWLYNSMNENNGAPKYVYSTEIT